MARGCRPQQAWQADGQVARGGVLRRLQQPGCGRDEEGERPQDGRSEQRVQSLRLVVGRRGCPRFPEGGQSTMLVGTLRADAHFAWSGPGWYSPMRWSA